MALSQQSSSNTPHTPIVLSVAGSDSGGGAGIQADIKAISATGSYACSVISALTAQNTLGVNAVLPIPAEFIEQQFDAVFSDLAIDVVKIGMLGDANTIKTVASALQKYQPKHIVLDPVMVATSGDLLLAESAISNLINQLMPMASVITPNIPEALALLGKSAAQAPTNDAQSLALCEELLALGSSSVLLKGGHQLGDYSTDYWLSHDSQQCFSSPRINTKNTHGTGCSLSSAIASYLAQGYELATAIDLAKQYISSAIATADALHIGEGSGPVDHFFAMRTKVKG